MSDDRQEPPADDATRPLPPPEDAATRQGPAGPPVWSGRAGVPPPRPADYREPAEWYGEDQRGRRWWMPILLGILALLLLAVLGTGIWLVVRAAEDTGPEPTSPTPLPTSAPVTTAAPTTTAPTTEPPSTPPTTAGARIPMPPLVGLSRTRAQAVLDRFGLSYRVVTRSSDQAPGTVIGTEPDAGELVRPDEEVTLVVAAAASPSPSTTSEAAPSTPEPTVTR
ncbi:PASTA domain-containing protein [Micromonospora sp. DT47]|uniref:PASTA domain-containing protein n=1 Tax=Micromonospora sp. DT47 TaxID=3393431 RepID=UPI003CE79B48